MRATRAPELRPAFLGGRALPAVRSMRVRVTDDGAVERTDAAGRTVQVAAPGEVARVLWIDELNAHQLLRRGVFTGPLLVLVSRAGAPLLALRLLDWAPPVWTSGAAWREGVGVDAFARALDLPVEPADDRDRPDRASLQRVFVTPVPPTPWPGRAAPWLCALATVFGFFCLPTLGDPDGVWVVLLTVLAVGPVIVSGFRSRADARSAGPAPGADVRTVVRPRPQQDTHRGLLEATIQVGPDDVVLTDRGREVWLPGPARHGVTSVVVEPEVIRLTDSDGNDVAGLATELWAPSPEATEDLARELRDAGLDVVVSPLRSRGVALVAAPHTGSIPPRSFVQPTERGDATIGTPWLSGVPICLAVVGALGALTWSTPVGLLLLALTGTALGLRVHDMVRITLDDWRATRKVAAPQAVRS